LCNPKLTKKNSLINKKGNHYESTAEFKHRPHMPGILPVRGYPAGGVRRTGYTD
jgi:hypothetical protein